MAEYSLIGVRTMKKVISWLLVVVMTAAISVGGTMAYLSNTDEDVNVFTVGNVKIDQLEYERIDVETKNDDAILQEFHDDKPLYPAVADPGFDWSTDDAVAEWNQIGKNDNSGIWNPNLINNEQDKMVFVKNTGDLPASVRTVFAFECGDYSWDEFQTMIHMNLNDTDYFWEWIQTPVEIDGSNYFLVTATYQYVLEAGQLTEPSLLQVALDGMAGNDDIMSLGDEYTILAASQAMQAEGFTSPEAALVEGFYRVTTQKHPFMEEFKGMLIYDEYDLREFALVGGEARVMDDFEVTSRVYFSTSDYVLDMNGHTLTNSNLSSSKTGFAIRVDSGSTMSIKGNGRFIDNHVDKDYYYSAGIFCVSGAGSVLTIEDGYYNVGIKENTNMFCQVQASGKIIVRDGVVLNSETDRAGDLLYCMSNGICEIYGGFFRNNGSPWSILNVSDGNPGWFTIYGGTFVDHYPGKANDTGKIKVADGYTVISEEQPNGEIWYTVVPAG